MAERVIYRAYAQGRHETRGGKVTYTPITAYGDTPDEARQRLRAKMLKRKMVPVAGVTISEA